MKNPKSAVESIVSLLQSIWVLLKPGLYQQKADLVRAYLIWLCGAMAIFCGPYILAELLDNALPGHDLHFFYICLGAFSLSLGAHLACAFLKTYFIVRGSERVFLDLKRRLVSSLLRKRMEFFSKYEPADLLTRISGDTDSLSVLFFDNIFWMASGASLIVLYLGIMLIWEWRLGMLILASLPCYVALVAVAHGPLARATARARQELSCQNEIVLDLLAGIRDIRFYQQQGAVGARFDAAAEKCMHANISSLSVGRWALGAAEILSRLVATLPFFIGGWLICRGSDRITAGTVVAYSMYAGCITYSLEVLQNGFTKLAHAEPLIHRIQEVLDYPEEEIRQIACIDEAPVSTRLEFRNVSYAYPSGEQVIRDFNMVIEPGEKVALMGPSGSGKSTVIGMLVRQLKPVEGLILLDGRPIEEYPLPFYLQHFSYVMQQPYIFKMSVSDNIALGWCGVPSDIIVHAAERVEIHEACAMLPQGYDTILGREGTDLSGGQRQRLALARALIREPAILLLDEFTSALDQKTEQEILDDLFSNFGEQTILCVTHSQKVASRFSRIVHIEKL